MSHDPQQRLDAIEDAQHPGEPWTFIQWKGTNLCMDLRCTCGTHSHYDGYYMYYIRCADCGQVYMLGSRITCVPVTHDERAWLTQENIIIKDDIDVEGGQV